MILSAGDMTMRPEYSGFLEDLLDLSSLEFSYSKKIKVDTFSVSEMEGNSSATYHIESFFPSKRKKSEEIELFGI